MASAAGRSVSRLPTPVQLRLLLVLLYIQTSDKNLIIINEFINELGLKWKIRHGAIVENGVAYVYAKFGDDPLRNEKALADRTSDNNINTHKKNKNKVGGAGRPVSGSKNPWR